MMLSIIYMKMTIVIDSEDTQGIDAALKIARLMHVKYVGTAAAHKESFGKIEFIKMLRKFGNEAMMNYKSDENFELEQISSLRFTKHFADNIWNVKND